MRYEALGLTIPSVMEKEYILLLSVKNWKEVGKSLLLTTFKRRFVVCYVYTSPKWTDLELSYTSYPSATPRQLN